MTERDGIQSVRRIWRRSRSKSARPQPTLLIRFNAVHVAFHHAGATVKGESGGDGLVAMAEAVGHAALRWQAGDPGSVPGPLDIRTRHSPAAVPCNRTLPPLRSTLSRVVIHPALAEDRARLAELLQSAHDLASGELAGLDERPAWPSTPTPEPQRLPVEGSGTRGALDRVAGQQRNVSASHDGAAAFGPVTVLSGAPHSSITKAASVLGFGRTGMRRGAVGVGQAVAAAGPAGQLFPAFVVGEGVFDGNAVGGVLAAVAFPLLDPAGQCSGPGFPRRCDGLPAVVAAQAEVAVVQEDLDVGEVLEADGDALVAGGRGIVRAARPQSGGP